MATYELGKVGMTLRGTYNASASYNALDVVTYNGSSYAALQPCTGVPVTNTNYWQLLCAGGAESYSTEEVCTGGTWVDGKPLYRKTFIFNSIGSVDLTPYHMDFCMLEGYLSADYADNGYTYNHPTYCNPGSSSVTNDFFRPYRRNTGSSDVLIIQGGNYVQLKKAYIIATYTKTTD